MVSGKCGCVLGGKKIDNKVAGMKEQQTVDAASFLVVPLRLGLQH